VGRKPTAPPPLCPFLRHNRNRRAAGRRTLNPKPGRVKVLSFAEGLPTPLAGFIPRVVIVPLESAYPGFGGARLLAGRDHIDLCKASSRSDEAYAETLRFVRACVGAGGRGGGGGGGGEGRGGGGRGRGGAGRGGRRGAAARGAGGGGGEGEQGGEGGRAA
jgi:hypothetical protein